MWLFKRKLIKIKVELQFLSHINHISSTQWPHVTVPTILDIADREHFHHYRLVDIGPSCPLECKALGPLFLSWWEE